MLEPPTRTRGAARQCREEICVGSFPLTTNATLCPILRGAESVVWGTEKQHDEERPARPVGVPSRQDAAAGARDHLRAVRRPRWRASCQAGLTPEPSAFMTYTSGDDEGSALKRDAGAIVRPCRPLARTESRRIRAVGVSRVNLRLPVPGADECEGPHSNRNSAPLENSDDGPPADAGGSSPHAAALKRRAESASAIEKTLDARR